MATHSSVVAWRIPGTGSLVDCCLWGRTESDTTEATQQQQQVAQWLNKKKNSACQCRRPGFDPGVEKIPWRKKGNPLQSSCLENPMDKGAWWATVHGVTKSQT